MPRNGSGTYSLPSGNPVVTGSTISSTTHNNTMSDVATALSASLAKDGQTTPSANLPMGGYKHINVADAAARTQYCSAGQAQDNELDWLSSVSGTNTITATAPLSMSAYKAGQHFRFVPAGANTGAATININAIGAKSITKNGTVALAAGDLPANAICEITYDGTQFQLVSIGALQVGATVQAYDADIPTVAASQAEMEAGTEAALRSMSPLRVAQAITAQTNPLTLMTAQASTSGTSIDFTSIPSWVKRITMGLVGVGTNGTSVPVIRIGDSGGYESTNYLGAVSVFQNGLACTVAALSSGCALAASWGSTLLIYGEISFQKIDGNTWAFSGSFGTTGSISGSSVSGTKELSATLDRIQLTTVNGTDAFDAGLVNVIYE